MFSGEKLLGTLTSTQT